MPNRCVAGNCGNFPNPEIGIFLHEFPFYGSENPEAKRRRRKWAEFVKAKRKKWEPTKSSKLCSAHFKPEDFQRLFHYLEGQGKPSIKRLVRDEIGPLAIPSIHAKPNASGSSSASGVSSSSRRERRKVGLSLSAFKFDFFRLVMLICKISKFILSFHSWWRKP